METSILIWLAALGFGITFSTIPLIRRQFGHAGRFQLHHTHKASICRFGGLSLALAFAAVTCIAMAFNTRKLLGTTEPRVILFSSLAMFVLGFIDDIRPLGAKRKLLGQLIIASAVYFAGLNIGQFQNPLTGVAYQLGPISYFATVLWLVAFTNLINLVDGVDGLAAGISLIMMILLFYVGYDSSYLFSVACTAGVIGALAGFLLFNFPPASIYLGDGGAYFLGFLIGLLSMAHSQKGTVTGALIAPLFVLALPIVDVTIAILRRGLRGLPLFRPDRHHLHHRLQAIGLSRTRVVLGFYSCTLFFLLLGLGVVVSKGRWLSISFGLACTVLILSARSFSFSREWFAIGKVLGNSLEIRKQARYALSLTHWLELEAERTLIPEELWTSFGFSVKKMGFSAVTLSMPNGRKHWNWWVASKSGKRPVHRRRVISLSGESSLEFTATESVLDDRAFELLTELAAEGWTQAVKRWQTTRQLPFDFKATVFQTPELSTPQSWNAAEERLG